MWFRKPLLEPFSSPSITQRMNPKRAQMLEKWFIGNNEVKLDENIFSLIRRKAAVGCVGQEDNIRNNDGGLGTLSARDFTEDFQKAYKTAGSPNWVGSYCDETFSESTGLNSFLIKSILILVYFIICCFSVFFFLDNLIWWRSVKINFSIKSRSNRQN